MPYPKRHIDLTGQTFGRLRVLEYAGVSKFRMSLWKCLCECGTERTLTRNALITGNTTSCGCWARECSVIHGHTSKAQNRETTTFRAWKAMKARCTNPRTKCYKNYGGRGIKVCAEWMESFEAFLRDMGEAPKGYSLERKENDGDYCKDNCVWIPLSEQAFNKRTNKKITRDGVTKCATQWAREFGLKPGTVIDRIAAGWPEEHLFDPPDRTRRVM